MTSRAAALATLTYPRSSLDVRRVIASAVASARSRSDSTAARRAFTKSTRALSSRDRTERRGACSSCGAGRGVGTSAACSCVARSIGWSSPDAGLGAGSFRLRGPRALPIRPILQPRTGAGYCALISTPKAAACFFAQVALIHGRLTAHSANRSAAVLSVDGCSSISVNPAPGEIATTLLFTPNTP